MSDIKQLPIRVSEQELRDIEWLRRQLGERSMAHAVRRVLREKVEAMRTPEAEMRALIEHHGPDDQIPAILGETLITEGES